jgi:hypothetical protein
LFCLFHLCYKFFDGFFNVDLEFFCNVECGTWGFLDNWVVGNAWKVLILCDGLMGSEFFFRIFLGFDCLGFYFVTNE